MSNELPFTPTNTKTLPRRGPAILPGWVKYHATLQNPTLRDGNWYDLDLTGLSFAYARKLAIQAGFRTAARDGVLSVCWKRKNTPAPAAG